MITNTQIESWLSVCKRNASRNSNAQELSIPEWLKLRFPLLHQEEFAKAQLTPLDQELPDIILINDQSQDYVTTPIREQRVLTVCQKFNQQFSQLLELSSCSSAENSQAKTARLALVHIITHHGDPVAQQERKTVLANALAKLEALSKDNDLGKEIFAYVSWLLTYGGDLSNQTRLSLIDCLYNCQVHEQDKLAACLEGALILQLGKYDRSDAAKEIYIKLFALTSLCASARLTVLLDVIAGTIEDLLLKEAATGAAEEMRAAIEGRQQSCQPQYAKAGH